MNTLRDSTVISLIVLTYNRPADLRRCLNSIFNMDKRRTPYEVLVVDDGSTVDNKTVVAEFDDKLDIRYVKKAHGGVASARNAGAKAAVGDLVAFIADDYVLPVNYLNDVTEFLTGHKDAYVITHNISSTGPSVFRYVQRLYYQFTLLQRFDTSSLDNKILKSFDLPSSRAAVFRKDMFKITGLFNEGFLTGEDGELGMRMAAHGIPVYFFMNKCIEHWEDKGLPGYLEQRVRYGASFYRAIYERDGERIRKLTPFSIIKSLSTRYYAWLKLSFRLGRGVEYVLLSPFILLFLIFYYAGFYRESIKKRSLSAVPDPSSDTTSQPGSTPGMAGNKLNNETERGSL